MINTYPGIVLCSAAQAAAALLRSKPIRALFFPAARINIDMSAQRCLHFFEKC